jgi:hypothetical protein
MKKPTKLDLKIISEITRAVKALGGDIDIQSTIASWGDSLTDDEVLMFLEDWHRKIGSRWPHGKN